MAYLVVQEEGRSTHRTVVEPVTVLGRHADCEIQLRDVKASRRHCRLELCDRGHRLVDLKSANGTLVNGDQVQSRILRAGDVIEIGSTRMTYSVERADVLRVRRLARHSGRRGRVGRRRMPLRPRQDAGTEAGESRDPTADTQVGAPVSADELAERDDADGRPIDPRNRLELALELRRLVNLMLTEHGDEGLAEWQRLVAGFSDEETLRPWAADLLDDREMMAGMLDLARTAGNEPDIDALLNRLVDDAVDLTGAERGFVILFEPPVPMPPESVAEAEEPGNGKGKTAKTAEPEQRVACARNFDHEPILAPEQKYSHAVVNEVIAHRQPLLSTNAHDEGRFQGSESVHGQRLLSVLAVPMCADQQMRGVLYIDNRFETGAFAEADLLWLAAIADFAAPAIDRARLRAELAEATTRLESARERINALAARPAPAEPADDDRDDDEADGDEAAGAAEPEEPDDPRDRGRFFTKYPYPDIIGRSDAMRKVFEVLDKAVENPDVPVLIIGENGTGKDLVAKALHGHSARAKRPFEAVNCAAVTATLFESTFFGHERGSFTGANAAKPGLFEQADGGTLFLDEVGEIPMEMQAKFLRVLQDGEVRRVGGQAVKRVDVRIVTATNRDLQALVRDGGFREDLYYRLAVVTLRIPPLRERGEDIDRIATKMFREACTRAGVPNKPIAAAVMDAMRAFPWPGNVRQLAGVIEQVVTFHRGAARITLDALPDEIQHATPGGDALPGEDVSLLDVVRGGLPLKQAVKDVTERVERAMVARVFRECGYVKTETAERLGISRPTLDAKLDAYGISDPRKSGHA
jgi:transcriptional regulator with GAF, ATPase, and Fis domain